jgi:hypothetical protein
MDGSPDADARGPFTHDTWRFLKRSPSSRQSEVGSALVRFLRGSPNFHSRRRGDREIVQPPARLMRLQLRAEAFNAFNWRLYSNHAVNVTASNFCRIQDVASTRTGQIGLPLTFELRVTP